ncbi:hypothetical protein AVEN_142345-1 [Araneus ventricosus]|uniref:Uncharacterized protein n=2 Tax=Araneus ventricosus TaxID=182803 RepID=A0A4Y2GC34_ARAVE|nr:hypothetical protein AVEN_142345-1 [Araneus ventricosus]
MRSLHTRRFVSVGFISDVHQVILEYSFFSEVKMNPKRIAAMWLLYRRLRRRRIKSNYWVHAINQKREQIGIFHTLLKELQKHENKFFNFFRMTIPSFNKLHQRLKTKIIRKNSKMRNSITSEERLALTLGKGWSDEDAGRKVEVRLDLIPLISGGRGCSVTEVANYANVGQDCGNGTKALDSTEKTIEGTKKNN